MSTKFDKILTSIGVRNVRHLVLRPWTFQIDSSVSWIDHGPVFNISAKSQVLRLAIGPNHILALNAITNHLRKECPKFFEENREEIEAPGSAVRNAVHFLSAVANDSEAKNDQVHQHLSKIYCANLNMYSRDLKNPQCAVKILRQKMVSVAGVGLGKGHIFRE